MDDGESREFLIGMNIKITDRNRRHFLYGIAKGARVLSSDRIPNESNGSQMTTVIIEENCQQTKLGNMERRHHFLFRALLATGNAIPPIVKKPQTSKR
jgi:hypothetical protein